VVNNKDPQNNGGGIYVIMDGSYRIVSYLEAFGIELLMGVGLAAVVNGIEEGNGGEWIREGDAEVENGAMVEKGHHEVFCS
jgi:hypothetical protein